MFGSDRIENPEIDGTGIEGTGIDSSGRDGFGVVALEEACHKAAGADAVLACDEELLAAAVALESARGLLEAAQAHVLDQLHLRAVSRMPATTVHSPRCNSS